MESEHKAPDRCGRCGAEFACGAREPRPCWCNAVALTDELRAQLAVDYSGCLCEPCLRELAARATVS